MFIDYTSFDIGIRLLIGGNKKAFKIANKEKFMGMLLVVVFNLQFGIVSLGVNYLLSLVLRAENGVVI